VRSEVSEIEAKLEAMRGALPALRQGCQEFAARAEVGGGLYSCSNPADPQRCESRLGAPWFQPLKP
jgi:hypothetical protein